MTAPGLDKVKVLRDGTTLNIESVDSLMAGDRVVNYSDSEIFMKLTELIGQPSVKVGPGGAIVIAASSETMTDVSPGLFISDFSEPVELAMLEEEAVASGVSSGGGSVFGGLSAAGLSTAAAVGGVGLLAFAAVESNDDNDAPAASNTAGAGNDASTVAPPASNGSTPVTPTPGQNAGSPTDGSTQNPPAGEQPSDDDSPVPEDSNTPAIGIPGTDFVEGTPLDADGDGSLGLGDLEAAAGSGLPLPDAGPLQPVVDGLAGLSEGDVGLPLGGDGSDPADSGPLAAGAQQLADALPLEEVPEVGEMVEQGIVDGASALDNALTGGAPELGLPIPGGEQPTEGPTSEPDATAFSADSLGFAPGGFEAVGINDLVVGSGSFEDMSVTVLDPELSLIKTGTNANGESTYVVHVEDINLLSNVSLSTLPGLITKVPAALTEVPSLVTTTVPDTVGGLIEFELRVRDVNLDLDPVVSVKDLDVSLSPATAEGVGEGLMGAFETFSGDPSNSDNLGLNFDGARAGGQPLGIPGEDGPLGENQNDGTGAGVNGAIDSIENSLAETPLAGLSSVTNALQDGANPLIDVVAGSIPVLGTEVQKLVGTQPAMYDPENGISGAIDSLAFGVKGLEVMGLIPVTTAVGDTLSDPLAATLDGLGDVLVNSEQFGPLSVLTTPIGFVVGGDDGDMGGGGIPPEGFPPSDGQQALADAVRQVPGVGDLLADQVESFPPTDDNTPPSSGEDQTGINGVLEAVELSLGQVDGVISATPLETLAVLGMLSPVSDSAQNVLTMVGDGLTAIPVLGDQLQIAIGSGGDSSENGVAGALVSLDSAIADSQLSGLSVVTSELGGPVDAIGDSLVAQNEPSGTPLDLVLGPVLTSGGYVVGGDDGDSSGGGIPGADTLPGIEDLDGLPGADTLPGIEDLDGLPGADTVLGEGVAFLDNPMSVIGQGIGNFQTETLGASDFSG